ncbi:folate-dependent phosphoribosylglycinamide formyltransferase [Cenarchaeum symbiosum A]|uniref:phosphoribosylglycinamide formyltransferase 1 n=1 Tax=Cenarchaeum symbiosum (strain A) TaxID=414004 RepID=A0RTU5_CENSY|nr:folate-dependent phosphoribosylglycinamide formyltransferase [Cenarchaeum symbiosum A]
MEAIIKHVQKRRVPANLAVVISSRSDARGLRIAERLGVDTEVVESRGFSGTRKEYDRKVMAALRRHGVTRRDGLVCLAGFMRIIGPECVKRYKHRMLNIHPALLPSFRGIDAQKQALEYGAKVSGCTVHLVDEGTDTGPVVAQSVVQIREDDTEESLSKRILAREHKIYPYTVELFARGKIQVKGRRVCVG